MGALSELSSDAFNYAHERPEPEEAVVQAELGLTSSMEESVETVDI
jgi:hypothetical protein